MSEHKSMLVSEFTPPHGSVRSYVIGFVSSIVLTLVAYAIATNGSVSAHLAIALIAVLAAAQCAIQLIIFLHLGQEFKPRWKLAAFTLMLAIVVIIVGGSWWIMDNLNYRMMRSPAQEQEYVKGQDGL